MSVIKSSEMLVSNVVPKERMREFQSATLQFIKEALLNSFGPLGSNTIITKKNVLTKYSKDGHTILQYIDFRDVIENSVKSDIEDITRFISRTVGDGTTSAIILSSIIFEEFKKLEDTATPYELIRKFKDAVADIKERIKTKKIEFTPDMAYDITKISTNGNEEVSENIRDIYKTFGKDVFIDVAVSNNENSYLKEYDGMTLDVGYSDSVYINNVAKGTSTIHNPKIYAFEDPIDTPEMGGMLESILNKNIISGFQTGNIIPTVILVPKISRDMMATMEQIIEMMYKFKNPATKPPLLIITNFLKMEQYIDIVRMCGCTTIKKYIDPELQKMDIEKGIAPTFETVDNFCGTASVVEADLSATKFVRPACMHDENGELSQTFNSLVSFLEAELKKAYENKEDNNVTGNLKRRLNSLKANMVEYSIGGISMSDRDSLRDLVEDAVPNCRSAARNGVGFGANFEGLRAANELKEKSPMHKLIFNAYVELAKTLYGTAMSDPYPMVMESLERNMPYNIREDKFDDKILCTIDTDIVILDCISKIVSIMFTSNQFICPSIADNRYLAL